ncbi:epimerase family protein SDR39U1 [Grus japonensis]|uniref:Epimerase family protein SDR39U1 n=1 Tax=Grus japonensis TaxID=30415 RepID=A0ABC9Y3V9_GRUJA
MPAGSKTDPSLAKAKPISASVITYLRRKTELLQLERGVRRCKKLCRHQGQCRRRGRRCSRHRSRDPPAARGEDHGEAGCPPAAYGGRMMVEQRFHLQPVEDPTPEQVETPEGGCDPMGSPHWSRLLAGPVAPWREEPRPEQVCWQDL